MWEGDPRVEAASYFKKKGMELTENQLDKLVADRGPAIFKLYFQSLDFLRAQPYEIVSVSENDVIVIISR